MWNHYLKRKERQKESQIEKEKGNHTKKSRRRKLRKNDIEKATKEKRG